MIEIKNVEKRFGDKVVFENLNIEIKDGDFVILTGKSGCGKTTLLYMIGGLENVSSGAIYVDGMDIAKRSNKMKLFSEKTAFLFQNFALVDNKTVRQNLEMIYISCRSDVTVSEALEMVGLADKIDEKVYKLSGGEQQRVALARTIIKKSSIILADEPTGSLDPENTRVVMDILKRFNEMGRTVIMVTHDMSLVEYGSRNIAL